MPEKESVTERTIQNDIAQLKKIGILRRKGGRKNGEWEIIKQKLWQNSQCDNGERGKEMGFGHEI